MDMSYLAAHHPACNSKCGPGPDEHFILGDVASEPVQVDDGEFMDTGVLYEDKDNENGDEGK